MAFMMDTSRRGQSTYASTYSPTLPLLSTFKKSLTQRGQRSQRNWAITTTAIVGRQGVTTSMDCLSENPRTSLHCPKRRKWSCSPHPGWGGTSLDYPFVSRGRKCTSSRPTLRVSIQMVAWPRGKNRLGKH